VTRGFLFTGTQHFRSCQVIFLTFAENKIDYYQLFMRIRIHPPLRINIILIRFKQCPLGFWLNQTICSLIYNFEELNIYEKSLAVISVCPSSFYQKKFLLENRNIDGVLNTSHTAIYRFIMHKHMCMLRSSIHYSSFQSITQGLDSIKYKNHIYI
jgi:hypothetical protein